MKTDVVVITNGTGAAAQARPGPTHRARRSVTALLSSPGARKGVVSLFDQAVFSGTSFATTILLARLATQSDLGVYYLAFSVFLLVLGVQTQVISAPYMVYCNRRTGRVLENYTGSTFIHQVALSGLTMLALAVAGLLASVGGAVELSAAIWVLVGVVPFLLLRSYVRHVAFAHLHFLTAAMVDVTVAVLQLGGLFTLAYFNRLTVANVYLVSGGACAAASFVWFLTRRQPIRINPSQAWADWRHNWSFGRWALAGNLLGQTSPYFMPWILVAAHGAAATGVLAACSTLVGLSRVFISGIDNFLGPRAARGFARGGPAELWQVLGKVVALLMATIGPLFLFFLLLGDSVAVWVFGEKYAGCGWILTLLALGMLIRSIGGAAGNGLWAIERPRANLLADASSLAVMLITVGLLVVPLGVLGVAFAMLAGAAAGAGLKWVALARALRTVSVAPQAI